MTNTTQYKILNDSTTIAWLHIVSITQRIKFSKATNGDDLRGVHTKCGAECKHCHCFQ